MSALPAQAAYIVTLTQEGPNVVANGSGTLDLTDLTLFSSGGEITPGIHPGDGSIFTGHAEPTTLYTGMIAGPSAFGDGESGQGSATDANFGDGEMVGIHGDALFVVFGYQSGASVFDTATYDNATGLSLEVFPGNYVWSWGSGADADTFTLHIDDLGLAAATVPEPSSLALLGGGLGLLGLISSEAFRRRSSG